MWTFSSQQFLDRSMHEVSQYRLLLIDIAYYCLYVPAAAPMHIYHAFNTLDTHTFLFQIMVAFLSYISNACYSLSGVAERLQHTVRCSFGKLSGGPTQHFQAHAISFLGRSEEVRRRSQTNVRKCFRVLSCAALFIYLQSASAGIYINAEQHTCHDKSFTNNACMSFLSERHVAPISCHATQNHMHACVSKT